MARARHWACSMWAVCFQLHLFISTLLHLLMYDPVTESVIPCSWPLPLLTCLTSHHWETLSPCGSFPWSGYRQFMVKTAVPTANLCRALATSPCCVYFSFFPVLYWAFYPFQHFPCLPVFCKALWRWILSGASSKPGKSSCIFFIDVPVDHCQRTLLRQQDESSSLPSS